MANPIRGRAALTLSPLDGESEGETLTLEYSIDAICQLEARLKPMTWSQILARFAADDTVTFGRTMLWGGLLEHQPGRFDERAAGELIKRAPDYAMKMLEALGISMPTPKAKGEGAARAPARPRATPKRAGTGKRSSVSGSNSK